MGVPRDRYLFMTDVSSTGPLTCNDMFLFMTGMSLTRPLACHVIFMSGLTGSLAARFS